MSRHYITPEELDELDALAAAWAREIAEQTEATGIGPMHHDYARLSGMLRRIRAGNPETEARFPVAPIVQGGRK